MSEAFLMRSGAGSKIQLGTNDKFIVRTGRQMDLTVTIKEGTTRKETWTVKQFTGFDTLPSNVKLFVISGLQFSKDVSIVAKPGEKVEQEFDYDYNMSYTLTVRITVDMTTEDSITLNYEWTRCILNSTGQTPSGVNWSTTLFQPPAGVSGQNYTISQGFVLIYSE